MNVNGETPKPSAGSFVPEQREIGRLIGRTAGPTLVVIGGMHGNEPGGARAAKRVLERLSRDDVEVTGEVIALAGNLAGLRVGRHHVHADIRRRTPLDPCPVSPPARPPEADGRVRLLGSGMGGIRLWPRNGHGGVH